MCCCPFMNLPVVFHPDYVAPLPPGHRFPMVKFRLLYQMLLGDEVVERSQVYTPELPARDLLELVHDRDYVAAYCEGTLDAKAQRRIGLPWSRALANRTCIAAGGAVLTAQLALKYGLACNTAGGTHHAFPSFGSGFCIFNDIAIACRAVRKLGLAQKILIVDLDVHQGDATAFIFQDEPQVFTFSMHCEANFPGRKQKSDLDVPLSVGMEDDEYLETLAKYLPDLLATVKPDLVFYDAGVDIHKSDRLGKLALTDAGLWGRERLVLNSCLKAGYPVAAVIGGGYADDLNDLVYRHSILHRVGAEVFLEYC